MKKSRLNLPVSSYELLQNPIGMQNDSRFVRVKVWIAHTGENGNHTVFSRESLAQLSKTLPYTPIVGFIKSDEYGGSDFKGHERRIVLKDNDVAIEYLGVPFGFIPKEPNSKFEIRDGYEYLTCEGYLWSRFGKALEIFNKANGRKSQSMEIDKADGFVDENGRYNITTGEFVGLCILGDDVRPAMIGSSIEFYSNESIKEVIESMITEYYAKEGSQLSKKATEKVEEKTAEETVVPEEEIKDPTEVADDVETDTDIETDSDNQSEEFTEEPQGAEGESTVEEDEKSAEEDEPKAEADGHEFTEEVDKEEDSDAEKVGCGCEFEIQNLKDQLAKKDEIIRTYEREKKYTILDKHKEDLGNLYSELEAQMDSYDIQAFEKEIVFTLYSAQKEIVKTKAGVYSYSSQTEESEVVKNFGAEIGALFKK